MKHRTMVDVLKDMELSRMYLIANGNETPEEYKVLDQLTDADIVWLHGTMVNCGTQRWKALDEYHRVLVSSLRTADMAAAVNLHEASLRERNRIWEEQRRADYIERNRGKSSVVYTQHLW